MKDVFKRICVSFAISSFCGMIVNLLIDLIANAAGAEDFMSISPDFVRLFPTTTIAAYVNIMLYGVIGASFAGMTFVFDLPRPGFVIQSIIYFIVTASVCIGITILLWQLHRHPQALIPTLAGYGLTYVIMGTVEYRELKKKIREINEDLKALD